jgi:hypothetical protein
MGLFSLLFNRKATTSTIRFIFLLYVTLTVYNCTSVSYVTITESDFEQLKFEDVNMYSTDIKEKKKLRMEKRGLICNVLKYEDLATNCTIYNSFLNNEWVINIFYKVDGFS